MILYRKPALTGNVMSRCDGGGVCVRACVPQAAEGIISGVMSSQASSELQGPEMKYCIKRLIRGLASDRDGARQGYATALAELIRAFPWLEAASILESIHDIIKIKGQSMNVTEQRNAYFGRIFGYMVLCSSARLFDSDEAVLQVVIQILDLGKKKTYLQELCCEAMFSTITQANLKAIKRQLATTLNERFTSQPQPDCVTLVLAMTLEQHGVKLELPWIAKDTTVRHLDLLLLSSPHFFYVR